MKKYKVSQEFLDALIGWQNGYPDGFVWINEYSIEDLPQVVNSWRFETTSRLEENKRLGAIINWINGEDVFEVGMPSYIVQRNEINSPYGREYIRIAPNGGFQVNYYKENATRFDDFKKASEWANKHFEVVEVNGNEL